MFSFWTRICGGTSRCRRREVPDGLDAVADQQVAHTLRGGGRDCQDADEDLPAAAQILQRGEGEDGLAAGVRPGDGGVGVKGCDDIQAVFRKAAVAQKRAAELTRADEHGVVRIIISEELLDILDRDQGADSRSWGRPPSETSARSLRTCTSPMFSAAASVVAEMFSGASSGSDFR